MTNALRVTIGQHSRAGCGQAGHGSGERLNQDFHGAVVPGEPLLTTKGVALALADGIGSSAVGHIASAAAVRSFLDDYYATSEAWSVRLSAQRVLGATNSWLHAQTMRSDARFDRDRGHVCTFSALVVKGRELHSLHVGDARICQFHLPQGDDGEAALEPLTEEHRVQVSSAESYLARALGAAAAVEIDYRAWPAEPGDVYLLATDGAWPHLDALAVQAALRECEGDFDAAAATLADIAQARGSEDDITVQLLRIDALPDRDALNLPLQRAHLAMPPALVPRMRFEGWTIVRDLHVSSRSHIHLAVDEASGLQAVLKTPSVDLRDDPAYLDRFLIEEWVARRIDNAHVLKPIADDRPRRHLYVAMEFIDGQTLVQWMTDHPRPDLDSVRAVALQVANGLQAFHGREMLHQDLRPDNVMIDRTGTAKIIDFGSTHVAGLVEGTADARADRIVGTLQYTAPEYFIGGVGTARSDLYSLAVLTYQMLTGELPYGLAVTQLRFPADVKHLRYVPLRHRRPELPAWVDAVLQKALNPEPSKRQEAVSEFAHDLQAPGSRFTNLRKPPLIERHPVRFWQVTTTLLALVVVVLAVMLATSHR